MAITTNGWGVNISPSVSPPIGHGAFMTAGGATTTLPDKSVWLRSGIILSTSSAPRALNVEHLKISGVPVSGFSANLVSAIATDPTGQYRIACWGSTTQVAASYDYGATWSLVLHALGVPVYSVCYGLGLFVVAGNNTGNILTGRRVVSTVGNFTSNGSTAVGTVTADTTHVAYGNNRFVAVCDGSSGLATSTTGTSVFTAQTSLLATTGFPKVTYQSSLDQFLIWSSVGMQRSQTCASGTFTSVTVPSGSGAPTRYSSLVSISTMTIACVQNTASYYYSTNFTLGAQTWTAASQPFYSSSVNVGTITSSGTSFYMFPHADGFQMMYSSDGLLWQSRWLTPISSGYIGIVEGRRLSFFTTTAASIGAYYSPNFSVGDFVGTSGQIRASTDSKAPSLSYRIK